MGGRDTPQSNLLFLKQAGKPVLENGRKCELNAFLWAGGTPHNQIYSLWNRPESLFLRMVEDVS